MTASAIPLPPNLAAAFAAAEFAGKQGKDVLLAAVCGFEIMLRIGAAITPAHYKIFHTTATTGVFGAAMAAGKLLDLDAIQLNWALGNAGTMSAGFVAVPARRRHEQIPAYRERLPATASWLPCLPKRL